MSRLEEEQLEHEAEGAVQQENARKHRLAFPARSRARACGQCSLKLEGQVPPEPFRHPGITRALLANFFR